MSVRKSSNRKSGFTLVELVTVLVVGALVTVAAGSGLVRLAASSLSVARDTEDQQQGRLALFIAARAVEREGSNAVVYDAAGARLKLAVSGRTTTLLEHVSDYELDCTAPALPLSGSARVCAMRFTAGSETPRTYRFDFLRSGI